jgi:hypothetical protein
MPTHPPEGAVSTLDLIGRVGVGSAFCGARMDSLAGKLDTPGVIKTLNVQAIWFD